MNTLRLDLRGAAVAEGTRVVVGTVMVDGVELFAAEGGVGPYPELLLEQLAAPTPSRVQVRICGCGEPGCWSLAARVRRIRGEVVWDQWSQGVESEGGFPTEPFDAPPLRFPARAYDDAVKRFAVLWEAKR